MLKSKLISFALASLFTLSIVGCSGKESTTNNNATNDEIVIGFIGPITGNLSIYGQPSLNGAELFFKENPEVLGKKIKLVALDDNGDPVQAVNAYNKHVEQNKAIAIIGAVTSKPSAAVATESQKLGTPVVTPTATALDVTKPGDNIFRACYIDSYQGETMANYSISKGYKNVAILYCQSDDYSIGLTDSFKSTFESNGGNIVASESFNDSDQDFKSQLTKIKESSPDALFIPYYYNSVALIANQVKDIGLETQLIGVDGWDGVLDVINDASVIEGAVYCNHYTVDDPYDKIQNFVKNYNSSYSKDPNSFAGLGYDAAAILYEAIKNANSTDSIEIVKALKATDLSVVTSEANVKFDATGNPIKGITIVEINNGKNIMKEKLSAK